MEPSAKQDLDELEHPVDPPLEQPPEQPVDPGGGGTVPSVSAALVPDPPPGSTAIPSGDTAIPSGNTTVPSGDTAVPSGNTAVPSGATAPGVAAVATAPAATAPVATAPTPVAAGGDTVTTPERLGEYLVRRLLGEGGMGKVYEAEERLSKRKVALKVLRPELSRSEHGRRLFLNEMTILAHLDHPNVVRCLSCTEVEGELVMALELLEGPTLRELLAQRQRLPWTEAVAIASQIAAGLQAAHSQQPAIVHRDLKPDNVALVGGAGTLQVKVMDFGIAKVLEALSSTTTHSVGTLQYMSPEQIDAGTIGPRTDLYALGLVLYEMLAGRPPFESPSPRELLNKQCTEAPPPLPDDVRGMVPKGIERLLLQLLQKRPEDRPEDAAAVLEALEPFATAGVPTLAPTPASSTVPPVGAAGPMTPMGPMGSAAEQAAPDAARAKAKKPVAADTIGIVERAAAPRQVPAPLAIAIILLLSVVAGVVTYLVRTGVANGATEDIASPQGAAGVEVPDRPAVASRPS